MLFLVNLQPSSFGFCLNCACFRQAFDLSPSPPPPKAGEPPKEQRLSHEFIGGLPLPGFPYAYVTPIISFLEGKLGFTRNEGNVSPLLGR